MKRNDRTFEKSLPNEVEEAAHNLLVKYGLKRIIGQNFQFRQVIEKLQQIASYNVPIFWGDRNGQRAVCTCRPLSKSKSAQAIRAGKLHCDSIGAV